MPQVHQVAQSGFGTGTNELYDRARPSYQPVALDFIRKSVSSKEPLNILEIGAGTGIFTRALLANPEWNARVREIKAIEPSEGMRDVFSRTISDSRVGITAGIFQNTGVEDGWADLVVIAQAYHWCPDFDAASAEFARVLKPEGVLAFIWNLEDRERAEWVAKLRDTYEAHEQGTPQFRLMLWRKTFDLDSYKDNFKAPEEKIFEYTLEATDDSVMNRVFSKSYIAVLSDEKKSDLQKAVKEILNGSKKTWINESEGIFEYPYETYVVVARRK